MADRVYDLLQDQRGEVEYAVFMSHFESVLGTLDLKRWLVRSLRRDFRQTAQPPVIALENPIESREVRADPGRKYFIF